MLRLARWVADYYAAPFESAIAAILPAAVRRDGAKFKEQLVAAVCLEAAPSPEEEGRAGEEKPEAGRRVGVAEGAAAK
jgi:primosomal protein N'